MTQNNAVVVHVQNTVDDNIAFQKTVSNAAAALQPHRRLAGLGIGFFVLSLLFLPSWLEERAGFEFSVTFVVALVIGILPLAGVQFFASRNSHNRPYDPNGLFVRPYQVTASSDGVSFESDVATLKFSWQAFLRAEETPTHFFLYIDRLVAYVFRSARLEARTMLTVLVRCFAQTSSPLSHRPSGK